MKSNLRDRFRDFLASEEGRVGVKAPLAVGIAGGSLLLVQAMLAPSVQGHELCNDINDCADDEKCFRWCDEWSVDWCIGKWHSECVPR